MLLQSITRNTVGLCLFAAITAGLIALTQVKTKERILVNEKAAASKALYEILPQQTHDNNLLDDAIDITDASLIADEGKGEAHVARKDGRAIAVILPAITKDGYSGKIKSIVGIREDGSLAGVRVVAHKETPGLGDKVEIKKSAWALQFNDKSYDNLDTASWAVQKDGGDFDQLTGATITPRAIVDSVRNALDYFHAHKETLLADKAPGAKELSEKQAERKPEKTP